jgi:hypothetical protein
MNRFEHKNPHIMHNLFSWLPIIAFLVLFILFLRGVNTVSDTTMSKQQESLETALDRSIAQCYAVEGKYPPSVSYLVEHYGLTYDADTFLVDYDSYGDNLFPDVTVIRKSSK